MKLFYTVGVHSVVIASGSMQFQKNVLMMSKKGEVPHITSLENRCTGQTTRTALSSKDSEVKARKNGGKVAHHVKKTELGQPGSVTLIRS